MPRAASDKSEWYADGLRFTCTQCGNCCTGPSGYVWFTDNELTAMAAAMNVTPEQFLYRYARKISGRWSLNERKTSFGYDCIFLSRDPNGKALCSIYPARPKQCRTWPFWAENLSSRHAYERTAQRCPGMQHGLAGKGDFYPIDQIRIIRDDTPER